jgi:hypothetical protein
MTFDQWIDSVNDQVRGRLGDRVRTEELSWDSAIWVGKAGTVVAKLDDTESAATLSFDNGERLSLAFQKPEGSPAKASDAIVSRLDR